MLLVCCVPFGTVHTSVRLLVGFVKCGDGNQSSPLKLLRKMQAYVTANMDYMTKSFISRKNSLHLVSRSEGPWTLNQSMLTLRIH